MVYAAYILGTLLGAIIMRIYFDRKTCKGIFNVDSSNPEKDKYLIEFDVSELHSNKKFILLKINRNADLSQK